MSALKRRLDALDAAGLLAEGGQFAVHELAEWPGHYIGRSSDNSPSLLLSSRDHTVKAPLKLAGLEVNYSLPCRLLLSGGRSLDEKLTTVRCTATDASVQDYFLHLMGALLISVGSAPTLARISEAILTIAEILQQLGQPARKTAGGCFGELVLIDQSPDPLVAVEAWHNAADDKFDFAIGNVRLEVKSSGNRARIHHFSSEQCSAAGNCVGVLVSLFVETCAGGMTLAQLLSRIEQRVASSPRHVMKLRKVVAEVLGRDATSALAAEFDEHLASGSIQLYDLATVPAIRHPLPAGVDAVRFRSDISHCQTSDRNRLVASCSRLADLLPK